MKKFCSIKVIFFSLIVCAFTVCCMPKCFCEEVTEKKLSAVESINSWKSDSEQSPASDQNSEKSDDNFSFIKSEENSGSFFYDGKWLIYSGIALIAISITGIVITFRKPKTYKNHNKSRSRNNSK